MSACSANLTFYCACFSHQIPCLHSSFVLVFPSVVCIPVCGFELSKFYILLCMLCPSNIRFAQCFCPHFPSVFCRLVCCFELSTLINILLCMLHPLDIGLAQCFILDFHPVICMLLLILSSVNLFCILNFCLTNFGFAQYYFVIIFSHFFEVLSSVHLLHMACLTNIKLVQCPHFSLSILMPDCCFELNIHICTVLYPQF